MRDQILHIANRLEEINGILSSNTEPTLEQAMLFFKFFNEFQDTNTLIEAAEALAHKSLDELANEIATLSVCIDRFMTLKGLNVFPIDYKSICKQMLHPYEEMYGKAKDISTQLWRDYQSMSNRLDYLPFDSDEYKELDRQCDAAKSAYDKAHADTNQAYQEYDAKQREYADLNFFKTEYVYVLIDKIKEIAESIKLDICNLRKEGNL